MKAKSILVMAVLLAAPAFAQPGPGACSGKDAPAGCKMMSAEEVKTHHEKMRGMKDRKSCMQYMDDHHKMMKERADKQKEKFADKPDHKHCMGMKDEAKADAKPAVPKK
ncbi:MAG: hypothetical protein JNN20_16745 [Betaproteobacteria bacterium]|nr:hypothetical protein [Betaproteobacteria bacterium]